MNNMENPELQTMETGQVNAEKIKLTNKILAKLFLWGMVAFSSIAVPEKSMGEDADNTISETVSFENRFKNDGLLAAEREKGKPVVVITLKDNIDSNFAGDNGPVKTRQSLLTDQLVRDFLVGGKIRVVERDSTILNNIIDEVKLGETGLIKMGEETKLGKWLPADYYVVSSITNNGDLMVVKNEIVDMSNGSSSIVSVESSDKQLSDITIRELTKKTEAVIEQIQLNQKNGQER